jgi:serine/threonine protein kinase
VFVAQPGLIVGNRYSLTQVIGRGGMGEVWKAHDRELDSACAVKFILQHLANDRGIRERFSREAKAVARLRSPHVIQILGVGEVENVPYLAMELLDGETLLARLERIARMHPAVTLKMLEQVAAALESAHQAGIVHRDLKPDNIWFWSGNKVFVKVLDFGVAKTGMTTESLQTATGALVGTPQYMSPEQALGNRDIDHRSDLWSLAVITMECLSGRRPFESAGLGDLLMKIVGAPPPPLAELAPDLPATLQEWWSKALARDPRDRFQSATELVDALRPHLAAFEVDGMYGAESARSARLALSDRGLVDRALVDRALVDRALVDRGLAENGASSARGAGTLQVHGASTPSDALRVSVPHVSHSERVHSERALLAQPALEPSTSTRSSFRLPPVDSLAAESAPPRAPGSVGPISSSGSPQQRRDSRQRTALIAGGLLALAVLVTLGRLFLSGPAEDASASSKPAPPVLPSPASITADPVAQPTAPANGAAEAAAPAAASAQRPALGQGSPWDPALRGNQPPEPTTTTQALQPQSPGAAEPRSKAAVAAATSRSGPDLAAAAASPTPAAAPASSPVPAPSPSTSPGAAGPSAGAGTPAAATASGNGSVPAGAKATVSAKAAVKPLDAALRVPGEAAAPHEGAEESEAARKERLRKATGL